MTEFKILRECQRSLLD